jgi:hypothetical protein
VSFSSTSVTAWPIGSIFEVLTIGVGFLIDPVLRSAMRH